MRVLNVGGLWLTVIAVITMGLSTAIIGVSPTLAATEPAALSPTPLLAPVPVSPTPSKQQDDAPPKALTAARENDGQSPVISSPLARTQPDKPTASTRDQAPVSQSANTAQTTRPASAVPVGSKTPSTTKQQQPAQSTKPPLPKKAAISITHPVNHTMQSYHFQNGDTITIPLSITDPNRLMVANDQIAGIICPQTHTLRADGSYQTVAWCQGTSPTNQKGQSLDPTHGVYLTLNPSIKHAYTAQVTTLHHRFFTLMIVPQHIPGVSVKLAPIDAGVGQTTSLPASDSYSGQLAVLMKAIMNNQVPQGYGYQVINHSRPLQINRQLAITPVAVWRGRRYLATAYQLINPSKMGVRFDERLFYHKGVVAVSLTKDTLAPKTTALIYVITTKEVNHAG